MWTTMTTTRSQPAHGDDDAVIQPLHSETTHPQPAWEMTGKRPERAPVLPTVQMWMRPYNPHTATMMTRPKSIQAADDNNMATAHASDNDNAPRAPVQPT